MNIEKEINNLYKILALYEELGKENSVINLDSYLNYIDKLYVRWIGINNSNIYNSLKGLWILGESAGHKRVKSTVFDMISQVERGGS